MRAENIAVTLQKWTGLLQKGDVILSFNWDILHEAALWRAGKWHYIDGYGFKCSDSSTIGSSQIKILKLHGSVNWAQKDEEDCEPAIEHRSTFFHLSSDDSNYAKGAGQFNDGRNLIIPTYIKDISTNKLLLNIWKQANEALVNATEIVIIGHQLNPADGSARQLIASSLLDNQKLKKITLVSPNGLPKPNPLLEPDSHWPEFCQFLDVHVYKRVRNTFEDWLK